MKTIVSNPDAVEIKRTIDEKGVLLELTVDPQDLGRVIGKRGIGAQSLRTLLRALGTKNDARYNLKIVDVGDERPAPAPERQEEVDKGEEDGELEADNSATDDTVSAESSEEEQAEVAEETSEDDDDESDDEEESRASRTRKELEDLDDLDI